MDNSPAPTSRQRRSALWASLFALLLGTALTVLVHEMGHWVAGALLGHPSTLYPFAVTHAGTMSATDDAITLLAGPAVSLLIGLVMTTWLPLRRRAGLGHLLWLWVGFTSVQEAVTYLVITPFGAGDTADANTALGGGVVVAFVAFGLGLAGMFWQAKRFSVHVARHAGEDLGMARSLAWFPWLYSLAWVVLVQVGTIAITPIQVPAPVVVILILATIAVTVFAPMSFIFLGKAMGKVPYEPLRLPSFPTALAVGYAAMVVVNLVLALTSPTLG